ncbi:MAG: hypothetical protein H6600_07445 [Flavobacteriales bacterium]|nr:hypothetical protein [Flavobacteriales bacterium]
MTSINNVHAQDDPAILLEGKITDASGKKLSGVTITVKKNGTVVQSATTTSSGKYGPMNFPMGAVYTVVIEGPGYVSKQIEIDSKTGYFAEDAPAVTPLEIPFELDVKKPDVDYSSISNGFQIGKLSIDPASGHLAVNSGYTSQQTSKYKKFFEDLEKSANAEEEQFKKLVEDADKAFQAGNFDQALVNYQKALEIKQNDPIVTGKVTETQTKIEQKKQFDKAVSEGDGSLAAKNFDDAIKKYEQAKTIFPNDKTIDAKIKTAQDQKAAAESAEIDAKYNAKIKEAEKAFADKDYGYAKTLYQEAGKIKPLEKVPPAKIIEIDKIINDELAKEQQFSTLVAAGDKAMLGEDFDTAIEKYTAALQIKQDDRVKTELQKAKDLKIQKEKDAAAAAKKAEFDKFISSGNTKLGSEDFDGAISEYQKALDTGVDNATANAKIKEAQDKKKAKEDSDAAAAKKADFDKFIASGNTKLGSEDFDGAISEYQKALDTGVDNATANAKIKEAQDKKKAKEDSDAAAAKKADFDKFIASGNTKLGSEDFDGAISDYQKALDTGVDNATANAKIKEAQDAKQKKADDASAAAKKADFEKFIASGNTKLGSEDFDAAISEYQKALETGVDNATANAKIKEAQDKKKAKEDSDAAAAKKADFDKFIASGNTKLGSEDFDGAISEYQKALDTGIDNATANAKIKEAQDKKKAQEDSDAAAAKKADFDKFIASGNTKLGSEDFDGAISEYQKALDTGVDNATANAKIKEAQDAKKKKADDTAAAEKQAQFDNLISSGDGKLGGNDFAGAISEYEKALALGVNNSLANQKIQQAKDAKKAYEDDLAKQDAAAKKSQFDSFIGSGDSKLGSNDFDAAIGEYQKALALDFDNPTANAKIKSAQDAKTAYENEQAAKNEAAAAKERFDQLISSGDGKLSSKSFDQAIAEYQKALDTGVDNAQANAKIKEAKDAKAAYELELANQDAAAKQAQFDGFINAGNSKLSSKEFDSAISEYEKALATGFDNAKANAKIKEAKDAKTAYENEMAAQDAAAKEAQFNKYVSSGDGHLASNAFDMAINDYQRALELDVDNPLANKKIKAAQDAKALYEQQQAANDEAAAKEAQFNQLIAQGDAMKDAQDWVKAKDFYTQAKSVKQDSPIPQQKIDEVNRLMDIQTANEQDELFNKAIAKINELKDQGKYDPALGIIEKQKGIYPDKVEILNKLQQEIAAMKAKEDEYNKFLASADGKFESGKWQEAKADYLKAKAVFDRPRPNDQIAIIDQKLADAEAKNNADADLAKKKAEYDALMAKAKNQKDSKAYQDAIATYNQAKNLMPSESEPQQRINEINDLLAKEGADKALLEKYKAAIAKADAKRDEAIAATDKDIAAIAKDLYAEANKIKSDEGYPQEQVNRINELMAKWEDDDFKKQYQKIIDKADELFNAKNWDGSEKLYKRAIELNTIDPYPPAQLDKIKKAREAEGALDDYNVFIQEGNDLFGQLQYKNAISAYEKALAVKPTAKYPQQKIDEINQLLRDQANAAKAQQDQQKRNETENIPPYGEEVTGLSEDDVDRLFKEIREEDITQNDKSYEKVKSDELAFTENELTYQRNRSDSNNENYDEMESDRSDLESSWDDQRKENLPEMEEIKKGELEKTGGFSDTEVSRSYNIDRYNNTADLQRSETESQRDDRRKDNIVDMEVYKEDHLDKRSDLISTEVDVITTNQDYYNKRENEHSEIENNRDVRRTDNIVDMEVYKEDHLDKKNELVATEVDVITENQNYYNERESEVERTEVKRDERRTDNIVDMEVYKEGHLDLKNELVDQGVTSTYKTQDDYRLMANEYEKFADDGDTRRSEETVQQVDNYKFTQENIFKSDREMNVEVTDLTHEYNTNLKTELADFAQDMDIPRENNVEAVDVYKDELLVDKSKEVVLSTDKSLDNYQDKENVKEKQYDMFVDEDEMREENIDKMYNYKEEKLNKDADKANEFSGAGYDKSLSYDSIKNQKATMFSDENVDPLVQKYGQGVTEKMFQRTNNMGEVIEVTILRIVVEGNKADEYKKVTTKWTTSYFKNGGVITQQIWDTETN